ncbi:MAG: HAMP domain-containing sensor histidine kinase [Promethearchaeia archaeon]
MNLEFASSLLIIETSQFIIMILATIVITIAIRKRNQLHILFFAYAFLSIGFLFSVIELFNPAYEILTVLFYLFATLFLAGTIFYEYYKLFLRNNYDRNTLYLIVLFILISFFSFFSLKVLILALLVIGITLSLIIYSKKGTITFGFFSVSMIIAFVSILSILIENAGFPWAYELRQSLGLFLAASMLGTALVGILEYQMEKSDIQYRKIYNKAELYKDIFIHDVSNILQSILSATEICTLKIPTNIREEIREDLLQLLETIKLQVNRGSDLVSNIELLSKLDLKKMSVKEINLDEQIQIAINKVREVFSHKNSNIEYQIENKEIFVKANEALSELFYNILSNCFIHNKNPEAQIEIQVSKISKSGEHYVTIKISDNSIGINDVFIKEIDRIKYNVINRDMRLGLGLIFVFKLLSYYGGHVKIENREKGGNIEGIEFFISLLEA